MVRGQRLVNVGGSKFAEYYDAPNETQMKSLLECSKAVPQPGGRLFRIADAKLQTFRVTGQGELVVEAPDCLYDSSDRSISSAGLLHLRTADVRFNLDGEGFLWQQTNSMLFVSNRVHTIIHADLAGGQPTSAKTNAVPAETSPIDVFSDQFEYAVKSGQGIYRGNVRVSGTNMALTAGLLTVDVPMAERRLQSLVATENVVVDYLVDRTKTQAKGQRVTYDADSDQFQISGQPSWRADLREGHGDHLLLDRKNGIFRSTGNAWLKMPSQGAGQSSFLPHPNVGTVPAAKSTNQFVEISSDDYVIRTNSAVFHENVKVNEWRDEKLQGKMSCGEMTAAFTGTNELQQLVAERNVIIESETNRFSSGRAVYTGTNGILELTEQPAWQAGVRQGHGEVIVVNVPRNEMHVISNATMRLPAEEMRQSTAFGPAAPRKAAGGAATNQWALISAEEYAIGREEGRFQRHVRIDHPQMQWGSDTLTARMPPSGGKIPHLVAEGSVAFDLIDDHGQKVHGTGEQAVYNYQLTATTTNETMELTGSPAVLTASTNIIGRNNVVLLDLTTHRLTAHGLYNILGTSLPATNALVLPKQAMKR